MYDDRIELPGVIVSPKWLVSNLEHPGLRLLDVRERRSYERGHIPGAGHLDLASLDREVDGVPGMVLPAEAFAEKVGQAGIAADDTVILYDDNWGLPAARVLWALALYGNNEAAVLNGGIDRWQDEGRPLTSGSFRATPASFRPEREEKHLATGQWIKEHLGHPDVLYLDTRAPGEHAAGHLPGAVCWDWINGVPMGSWNAVRSADSLMKELAGLGVTPDKEIVTYCRTGMRAAHTYLLLRHLGFPRVRLYDGSWLHWVRHDENEQGEVS